MELSLTGFTKWHALRGTSRPFARRHLPFMDCRLSWFSGERLGSVCVLFGYVERADSKQQRSRANLRWWGRVQKGSPYRGLWATQIEFVSTIRKIPEGSQQRPREPGRDVPGGSSGRVVQGGSSREGRPGKVVPGRSSRQGRPGRVIREGPERVPGCS